MYCSDRLRGTEQKGASTTDLEYGRIRVRYQDRLDTVTAYLSRHPDRSPRSSLRPAHWTDRTPSGDYRLGYGRSEVPYLVPDRFGIFVPDEGAVLGQPQVRGLGDRVEFTELSGGKCAFQVAPLDVTSLLKIFIFFNFGTP